MKMKSFTFVLLLFSIIAANLARTTIVKYGNRNNSSLHGAPASAFHDPYFPFYATFGSKISRANHFVQTHGAMATKHLARGSDEPPKVPGSVRFYSMRYCPYAQRTQLVLNAKGIKHDTVFINLADKPEWYLNIFPAGKVPALIYDDKFLSESLLLADFLDEQYPEPPLWYNSPLQKIVDKIFIESFGKVGSAFYKLMMTSEKLEKGNFDELLASLKPIEAELVKRRSPFFGGNSPKMVDYMIWPWFERLDALKPFSKGEFAIPFDTEFPKLAGWKTLMIADKAVAPYYATPEKHAEHFAKRKAGLPSYDI